MKDGGRTDPGIATPNPVGLGKRQELNLFLLDGLNGGK